MLRHTELTQVARSGAGEYQMDGLAGWVIGSKMPRRYIHLSGRDHVNAVLEAHGVEVPKAQRPKPMLMGDHCPNCDALIGQSMLYCPSCGYVLDPNVSQEKTGKGQVEARLRQLKKEVLAELAELDKLELDS